METSGAGASSGVRVLIVEDDETIGRHLVTGLRSHGYRPSWSRSGSSALATLVDGAYEAVLLDLGLPDGDGLEVARTLRARDPEVLILIVTARSDDIDIIAGLDAGADDYLVKPFSLTVLLAHLRAQLRRRVPATPDREPIRLGDLTVDLAARRCIVCGTEIRLRPKEFELLAHFAVRPGEAISRESLMAEVWDENWFGPTKTLDVTMASLRRQLGLASEACERPGRVPEIVTLRGFGYRLEP